MGQQRSITQSRFSQVATVTGSARVGRVLSRKQLWIGPALTAVMIVAVGWWANRSVENAVKTNLAGQLQALLDSDVAALEFWLEERRVDARSMARTKRVRQSVVQLAEITGQSDSENVMPALLTSTALGDLRERMRPLLESGRIEGFLVIDASGMILARQSDTAIGDTSIAAPILPALTPVFEGKTVVIPPFPSVLPKEDSDGTLKGGVPVMSVASPIKSDDEQIVAALCLELNPDNAFTRILQVARTGRSGETYAFNSDGLMVTGSRFDDELKRIGLLLDDEQSHSILNVQIRDPGVDMTQGHRSKLRRPDQPLTRMAAAAISRKDGVDVEGYRDYRGVKVVGAWKWLPRDRIGVATEVDAAEAFQPLNTLRLAFAVLVGMLLATSLGLCGLAFYASRLDLEARRATLEAKRLGQYALGEELGAGGMGVVYRAHHDMLHRPTAVKLLHVDKTNEQSIRRFEREVQLTSRLTHPNTIAIYDYGRTPEGVFFYAMEYLDGLTLDELVKRFGPLPESRVIYILRQLCGSLSEAHGLGLIHRDIKPANIMLTRCGGMCDFVKLLDFGLVKPQDVDLNMTMAGSFMGTPLYLSPEAVQHQDLDARSDLYAVGAVGYFLLTGKPVFEGESVVDICAQHVKAKPQPPSLRVGKSFDKDLEQLIMRCLAKKPEDRPSQAEVLEEELARCQSASHWTRVKAQDWWNIHLSGDVAMTQEALTETIETASANDQATTAIPE